MPKLRYIFGEENFPASPPLNIEEEGDSWWSGVNFNSVAIPIFFTLAAITLSASLCLSYQQQTEDIFPPIPAPPEEDYWRQPLTAKDKNVVTYYLGYEELPIAPADNYPWQVYVPPYESCKFIYLPDPEEIPAGSLAIIAPAFEDDSWITRLNTIAFKPISAILWDDASEIVLQPQGPAEEDFWQVYVPDWPLTHFIYLVDPEEIPAGYLQAVPALIVHGPRIIHVMDKLRRIGLIDKVQRIGQIS